jgi:phosphatidylserine synthase
MTKYVYQGYTCALKCLTVHTNRWKRLIHRSVRSVLHSLNACVGYLQMLLAMTFDLRIFIAVLLGSVMGFFVLGPYFESSSDRRAKKIQDV